MRQRPLGLSFLATLLWISAGLIPIQLLILYEQAPWELKSVAAQMTPLNWVITFTSPYLGYLAWRASPGLLTALPMFIAIFLYNNYLVMSSYTGYSVEQILLGTVVSLGALLACMFHKKAYEILLSPEKRWWLTAKRKQVRLPIEMAGIETTTAKAIELFDLSFFDLSRTGGFIALPEHCRMSEILNEGARLQVKFIIRQPSQAPTPVECSAEVVRKATAQGTRPAGLGVKFLGLDRKTQSQIESFLEASGSATFAGANA